MKIIEVEQDTPEWLSWRKTVITATDASAILGNNPWVTPYKCWQKKLGLIRPQKSTAKMERGKRLEPIAREHFIKRYGIEMQPAVVESNEFNFLGASLDGINFLSNQLLEIKCGDSAYEDAKQGVIAPYYMDQMQHQLLVTGAEKCFYYSFDGKDGICIEVLRDPEFRDKFLPKAKEFWKQYVFFEPPKMKNSDYKNLNDNLELEEYSKIYRELDLQEKSAKEKKEYLRKKIIEICAEESSMGHGLEIVRSFPKGKVAYDQIPELKSVDLDKYRKPASDLWTIRIKEAITL